VAIAKTTGVDVIAVVKADAYGLGMSKVIETIDDLVASWCVFSIEEAKAASACDKRQKPILVLSPSTDADPQELLAARIHPAVWNAREARRLRATKPVLSVDTGMQRFACSADQIEATIVSGQITEAFTHATGVQHVRKLISLVGDRGLRLHAAASALLDQPELRLNAVRPGMALYRSAARISTRLVDIHNAGGPAGYTGFIAPRFGIILCGYSNGLRKGICLINGSRRAILEVGMQSAYVELGPDAREGDEVVLLGDGLTEAEVGQSCGVTQQSVLLGLSGAGERAYALP
jgi:alanine racemase